MLSAQQQRSLSDLFPGDGSSFAAEETLVYGTDTSRLLGHCDAVVRPESTAQVSELLKWAHAEKVRIYPRARATNVAGATVPDGGVVVSTLRMNRILDINADDFCAVVQPGVVTGDLQAACARQHLFYPPDPASLKISTIGGNVATCAGGMRAVKYGVTREYVLGMEAVIPGGKIIRAGGRSHKNVAGLDLTRLFVGSEGTLGIMTEITLKLIPHPEASASLLVGFETLDHAMLAARSVFQAGFLPTAMEFMDGEVLAAIAAVAPAVPWPDGTGAAFLFRLDGSEAALAADLERLENVLATAHPLFVETGRDEQGEERLWELRRLISPALYNIAPSKSNDDVVVPRGKIAEAIEGFRKIGRKYDFSVLCFGHLGDGNIHLDVMYDGSDPVQASNIKKCKNENYDLVLSLGGTLTGEHGVGIVKMPYIGKQLGRTERALMQGIKRVFDPANIMNPGKAY